MPIPELMRAWRVHAYGRPAAALQQDEIAVPAPGPGELLVRVEAIPLNLNDIDRVTGANMVVRPPLPTVPGMEVFGVVAATGEGCEDRLGERVAALPKQAFGGFAEYAVCPPESAFEVPETIALPDAAGLYFPFHLAWLGLIDRARIQAGESVLIHAAAGGAGSAAIQLAKVQGARVFATASTEAKLALCRELGADVTINYAEDDFAQIVLDETDGRGVDVVFDNVGPAVMEASIKCVAYNGRYLMMGFASDKSVVDEKAIVPRSVAAGNFHMSGVMLAYMPEAVAPLMKRGMGWNFIPSTLGQRIMREVNELVLAGRIKPVIGKRGRIRRASRGARSPGPARDRGPHHRAPLVARPWAAPSCASGQPDRGPRHARLGRAAGGGARSWTCHDRPPAADSATIAIACAPPARRGPNGGSSMSELTFREVTPDEIAEIKAQFRRFIDEEVIPAEPC